MSATQASNTQPAAGSAGRLHLCLLDHDGSLRGAPADPAFDLADLIRKTYDVSAHPDMPQGVYARMEGRLKVDAGSAGYYMCKTQSGATFWIAVSTYKTHAGRVACHMPVTSPLLEKFAAFYAHLRQAEVDGLGPEESAERLLDLMVSQGVSDYLTLATSIMIEEIGKRDVGHNRKQYRDLRVLQSILETLKNIDGFGKKINKMSARSRLTPYQLKLQASRLEGRHGPLSVIADNHQLLTTTLLSVTADLQKASSTELDAVLDSIAYVAQCNHAVELLEAASLASDGASSGDAGVRAELHEVINDCNFKLSTLLSNIDRAVSALGVICHNMRRAVAAIEMTSMMCKIERARLNQKADGLRGIEEQLNLVQSSLSKWMSQIDTNATAALTFTAKLKREQGPVAKTELALAS